MIIDLTSIVTNYHHNWRHYIEEGEEVLVPTFDIPTEWLKPTNEIKAYRHHLVDQANIAKKKRLAAKRYRYLLLKSLQNGQSE